MKLAHDDRFAEEMTRYRLRFTCEDCACFDHATERCAHGFPTAEHRRARYASGGAPVVFCKDFSLE